MQRYPYIWAFAALLVIACSGEPSSTTRGPEGPTVAVTLAPLELAGIGDVEVTIEVRTGNGLVWRKERLAASQFGDGRGLTYVGPCDSTANPNTVNLWIDDLYGPGGQRLEPATWRNPTVEAPLARQVQCSPNADSSVTFDVTILRAAGQGFFDMAVEFDDIFCAAKFDCGTPGARRALLFAPGGGERIPTAVLGFVCTGGLGADTVLWLDDVVVECGGVATALDLRRGPGNHYTVNDPAPPPFAQVASYRGVERLADPGGVGWNQVYFNLALGLAPGDQSLACSFAATLSASDGLFPDGWSTPEGSIWPLIHVAVPFVDPLTDDFACGVHQLDDPNAAPETGVWTDYTDGIVAHRFEHRVRRDALDSTGVSVEHEAAGPGDGDEVAYVAGRVYRDEAQDGVEGPGDSGLDGVVVELRDASGGFVGATTTAGGGAFRFVVPAGRAWQVGVDPAQPAVAPYDGLTSAGLIATANLAAGQTTSVAFGVRPRGEIGGIVFRDADGDGTRDPGEVGVGGLDVRLRGAGGGPVLTTTTGADGRFTFASVPSGAWQVELDETAAAFTSRFGRATTTNPISVTRTPGPTPTETPPIGVEPLGAVLGAVFADADADGVRGGAELGVPGVTVTLTRGGEVRTTTTDGGGLWRIELPAGTWTASVDLEQPALFDYASSSTPTSILVQVGPAADLSVDFGVLEPAEAVGRVFVDGAAGAVADRVWDPGDSVIVGVAVTFTPVGGGQVIVVSTDAGGVFAAVIPPGDWQVWVAPGQGVLGGYVGPFFGANGGTLSLAPGDFAELDVAFEEAP